jgi:NAD(P)-dependent dehydrogenase (short-subunit alcohol dehydrogenase family)
MSARFVDKVVLVTGGGSGIGRTTAQAFAQEGALVVVSGRNPERLAETVKLIEQDGGTADAVPADVARRADVQTLVHTVVDRHGGLHIAFNNAGTVGRPAPTADLDEEVWDAVFAANTKGVWLSMKYEIAHMREHGGGVIVNAASNIGYHVRRPGMSAYAASKAAVSVLTRNAAREYVSEGIRINAVSPGGTDTTMSFRAGESVADRDERVRSAVPIGRVAATQEVADTVLWLASDQSSFVVGHDLVIDGGTTA